MPQNLLADETSPYLLQHADNPVDWMPWDERALDRARRENKPILLSVGYAACHWCHVMAHESFEDPAIAGVMNDLFVSIKVDREERPDIDTIYQSALAMLGQQGGWPLTMFLTPDGEPFWGGTYFPPTDRYGRAAFPSVLRAVADLYAREPEKIKGNVAALRDGLHKLGLNRTGDPIPEPVLDRVAERLLQEIDPTWGGIGGAPKFPQTGLLDLLWRAWHRTGETAYRDAVILSLTRMCQGGIYDHLGGGFARYATDAQWLVPHFEKMLYDNAQLISLLTRVWQGTRSRLFEVRVHETIAWALREMRVDGGGFAASFDADSEGEEGKFYVWTEDEIDAILGPASAAFKAAYDITPEGNWEGNTILNRRHADDVSDPNTEAQLAEAREALLAVRAERIPPGWDDKVLSDWNGLMIAALAEAGMVFEQPAWIEAALEALAFVQHHMCDGAAMTQAWRGGKARHTATLDAYANMTAGALALYEATGRQDLLDLAQSWIDHLDRHYWDPERGGYFLTADNAESLIVRTKSVSDNAVPSGNATMVGVLARLFHVTGDPRFGDRAEALVTAFAGEIAGNVFGLSTFLGNVALLRHLVQVVIVGPVDTPARRSLERVVLDQSLPDRMLVRLAPGATLPPDHPAYAKPPVDDAPTAYVCRGMTCLPPTTDPVKLAQLLTSDM